MIGHGRNYSAIAVSAQQHFMNASIALDVEVSPGASLNRQGAVRRSCADAEIAAAQYDKLFVYFTAGCQRTDREPVIFRRVGTDGHLQDADVRRRIISPYFQLWNTIAALRVAKIYLPPAQLRIPHPPPISFDPDPGVGPNGDLVFCER